MMRKTTLFGGIFLLFTISVAAQPSFWWDKTYGGDDYEQLHAIRPLADGNIILGGNTQSRISGTVTHEACDTTIANFDFWLLKTDIYGNKIWDQRYGGGGLDLMWTVLPTSDGGFMCGGFSTSNAVCDKLEGNIGNNGLADWWVVRTDSEGNLLWEKTYGTDGWEELREFAELPDGSFLALGWGTKGSGGNLTSISEDSTQIRLAKISPNGDLLWDKTYGGSGNELGLKLVDIEGTGEYLIGGQSASSAGTGNKTDSLFYSPASQFANDMWVIKINSDGNIIWDRTFGGHENDVVTDIEVLTDGGFLIGGQSESGQTGNKSTPNNGQRDFWLVKIDGEGNKIWDRTYGGSEHDDAFALYVNEEGEILFGGSSRSNAGLDKFEDSQGGEDFWMLFLEPNGDKVWDVSFGGSENDAMFDMFPVADGGVILGGHSASGVSGYKTQPNVGRDDFWIVKTNCKLELDLGPDTVICEGGQVELVTELVNCNDCRYRWSDGEREANRIFAPPISLGVDLVISSRSGCEIRDTINVKVNDAPEEIFANITPIRCPDEKTGSIQVLGIEGGTAPYYYSFNEGPWQEYQEFHNLEPGTYNIQVMDVNECFVDSTIVFEEPQDLQIIIDGTGTFQLGEETTLVPTFSHPIDSFLWSSASSLSCNDCLTPVASPLESTTYLLTAFNDKGCKVVQSAVVAIEKKRNVYFPTAFSPNNDGNNDEYMFYLGSGIEKVSFFRIYNRWGELMYELADYTPDEFMDGWDGKLKNRNMPSGPYIFTCEIEYLDGWVENHDGHFILAR